MAAVLVTVAMLTFTFVTVLTVSYFIDSDIAIG
jgi:hypothetical protein